MIGCGEHGLNNALGRSEAGHKIAHRLIDHGPCIGTMHANSAVAPNGTVGPCAKRQRTGACTPALRARVSAACADQPRHPGGWGDEAAIAVKYNEGVVVYQPRELGVAVPVDKTSDAHSGRIPRHVSAASDQQDPQRQ